MSSSPQCSVVKQLKSHTSDQTEAIEQLCSQGSLCNLNPSNDWTTLWESVWGKGLDSLDKIHKVQRGDDAINV